MIKRHWQDVINVATSNVTHALSEGINDRAQWLKRMARGYRSRERFHHTIYFHLGDSISTRKLCLATLNPKRQK